MNECEEPRLKLVVKFGIHFLIFKPLGSSVSNILLIGSSGYVGSYLRERFQLSRIHSVTTVDLEIDSVGFKPDYLTSHVN